MTHVVRMNLFVVFCAARLHGDDRLVDKMLARPSPAASLTIFMHPELRKNGGGKRVRQSGKCKTGDI